MLPRKRQRPNPSESTNPHSAPTSASQNINVTSSMPFFRPSAPAPSLSTATPPSPRSPPSEHPLEAESKVVPSPLAPPNQPRALKKTRSWYGSSPHVPKAATVTQVTRETIHGGTLRPKGSVDFSRYDIGRGGAPDTASVRSVRSVRTGSGSVNGTIPLLDMTKGEDASKHATTPDTKNPEQSQLPGANNITKTKAKDKTTMAKAETKLAPDVPDVTLNTKVERTEVGHARPNTPNAKPEPQDAMIEDDAQSTTDEILSPPMPGTPVRPSTPVGWLGWLGWGGEVPTGDATLDPESATEEQIPQLEEAAPATVPAPMEEDPAFPAQLQTVGGGWLDYWWSAPTSVPSDVQTADAPASDAPTVEIATIVPEADTKPASAPKLNLEEDTAMEDDPATKPTARAPSAGSTWAFWSRDTGPKDPEDPKDSGTSTPREPGEIAVIGEGSEMHPKAVDRKEIDPLPRPVRGKKIPKKDLKKTEPKEDEAKKEDLKTTDLKTAEAKTPDEEVAKDKEPAIPIEGKRLKNKRTRNGASVDLDQRPTTPSDLPLVPAEPAKPVTTTDTLSPVKQTPPNILLPSFASTYTVKENTSITRQIGRLILNSSTVSILGATSATSSAPSAHIFRTKTPLRIRRAVAIGVHGLFPSSYLRPMIGQPTGTSLRFAGLCADGIRRWADANGSPDCAIEKVALEGEGRIADRVDNLWKLLLNWIEHLRQADLILVACHSQGVPVGIMLLAKLIDLGIITHARIGVCAMAGVSLGPFPYRTASMLGGSAAELLEFANPQSEVSQRYEQALREILAYGARITYIGSIDDQLVPLESAVHSPLHHPYIYRAVFIDGRIHAPDFIAHLIGFALKLRNLGISDHGLVRELSSPLAGSLYTGEGHSRIYFDSQVYDLAITHTLETTDVPRNTEPEIRRPASGVVGVANANPYHLPWIMRGLLEEDRVKTELSDETAALLRKYDDWNPVTAKLKEVKYKLEAIRSHL